MPMGLLPYCRSRDPKYKVGDVDPGGGVDHSGIVKTSRFACLCKCSACVKDGVVELPGGAKACGRYRINLINSLEGVKTHLIARNGTDEFWESETFNAQLLNNPGELGLQQYRWRMTMGDPDASRSTTLILYRIPTEEGDDPFAGMIPANEPLATFQNNGFLSPLCGFKLDTRRGTWLQRNMYRVKWHPNCHVCISPVSDQASFQSNCYGGVQLATILQVELGEVTTNSECEIPSGGCEHCPNLSGRSLLVTIDDTLGDYVWRLRGEGGEALLCDVPANQRGWDFRVVVGSCGMLTVGLDGSDASEYVYGGWDVQWSRSLTQAELESLGVPGTVFELGPELRSLTVADERWCNWPESVTLRVPDFGET